MYAVVSMSTHNIADLADQTDGLKKEYCDANGYEFFAIKDEDFKVFTKPYSSFMDWNKALLKNAIRPSGALVFQDSNGYLSDEQFESVLFAISQEHPTLYEIVIAEFYPEDEQEQEQESPTE